MGAERAHARRGVRKPTHDALLAPKSCARLLRVPLSEDEQRILHEIERRFYESDPAFASQVSQTTLYRHAGRNC